jgi:predicted transcriptional regulator
MSDVFGAAGQVASAAIAANAQSHATQMQIDALNEQRNLVYNTLDPAFINADASATDVQRAKDRLALQGITDPELLKQRYESQKKISDQLGQLGQGTDQVAQTATLEALAGVPKMKEAQQKLIDAALKELDAGATLPPDVQNEIVQTGLERAGQTSGAASAKGFGGQILKTMLGHAGIELQNQRQAKATALTTAAQDLEGKRQQILGTLFPNLNTVQLNTLKGSQGVLAQSNQMVPEAGLGGTDIANLWLARVGATNQLAQSSADAASRGAMANGQIWGNAIGSATRYAAPAAGAGANNLWSSILGGGGGGAGMSPGDQNDYAAAAGMF